MREPCSARHVRAYESEKQIKKKTTTAMTIKEKEREREREDEDDGQTRRGNTQLNTPKGVRKRQKKADIRTDTHPQKRGG